MTIERKERKGIGGELEKERVREGEIEREGERERDREGESNCPILTFPIREIGVQIEFYISYSLSFQINKIYIFIFIKCLLRT